MKKQILIISISLTIIICAVCVSYSADVQNDLAQSVVRLHILANSDSCEDQMLKLAVRDRILSDGRELFKDAASKEETEKILCGNIDFLTAAAKDEIEKNGYSYDVRIDIGKYEFPMKKYDGFAFPAGEYDAVRVEIGEAKGHNWWCVMFPPLCFVDASVGEESAQLLRQSLTDEEMDIITSDADVDIRFKVVDFVQNSIHGIKTALKK